MDIQTPPTLLQLAGESLLRDQASAIAALDYLPAELFPLLFIQAYRRRIPEPLKAMVQAWPFTVLPLGGLLQLPGLMVLQAVLDGLDILLAQEVRPRRWKLQVLDLRNTGTNFWRMWCGDSTWNCSWKVPVAVHSSSPNKEHPLVPLEVFLDLNFNERDDGDEFLKYILQWAQQREGLLHLCCKALRISEVPFQRQTPLDKLSIENCQRLTHSDLTHLSQCPNLRQLKSLHLFRLSLADFSLEPLRALLEAVAPTLQDLRLDNCGMVDSQVEAILPVLSRCQQLRDFTISMNNFCVATVEKLLRHTAGLRSLELELYPVPLECYRIRGILNQERLAQIRAELKAILSELGQTRTIYLCGKCCHTCGNTNVYDVAFS
ncbi:PREDICTED: PRAME family member 16 [Myotis davidii]|uniref:PRAME family member 14 n=1 Tax=Myotis davidii TaxID=225400 RepID=L5LN79_MYODS|nr:PREDICTED: PRAME family member 16 [Myotis davidii]ELK27465.1 PRAME family member 14 [Myotis davidii]